MPGGRPTLYSVELGREICARIASGETLTSICQPDGMPDTTTVYGWLFKHEEFSVDYARARENQMEAFADQILDLSDQVLEDQGAVAKAKLQTENRKWLMARLASRRYGDKLQQEITGPGGVQPVLNILVSPIAPKALPESEE